MDVVTVFQIFNTIYFGILGLVIGSFLNVCIFRIPEGRTIVKGHSMCMTCGHNLGPLELVPLFSWIFLKGKCRYCGAPIASRYAKIEGLTGIVFAALAWVHRGSFILMNTSIRDFAAFGILIVLLALAAVVIVAMMIRKDHRTGMFRFPVFILSLFAVRIILELFAANRIPYLLMSAAASGMCAVILLGLIILFIPSEEWAPRTYFADAFSGKTIRGYFSAKNTGNQTSDLLFLTVAVAIGMPASIPCLIVYPVIRSTGKPGTFSGYYGIALAGSALIGLLFFRNRIF